MTRLWRTVEHCGWLRPLRLGPAHRSLDIIAAEGPTITEALAKPGEEVELSSAAFATLPPSWQG
jgi:hypothetical protein